MASALLAGVVIQCSAPRQWRSPTTWLTKCIA
jgi:hypothetical protein